MVRLTGCWDERLEVYRWSNVVCVRRDHQLYPHMERMTTRAHRYPHLYLSSTKEAAE